MKVKTFFLIPLLLLCLNTSSAMAIVSWELGEGEVSSSYDYVRFTVSLESLDKNSFKDSNGGALTSSSQRRDAVLRLLRIRLVNLEGSDVVGFTSPEIIYEDNFGPFTDDFKLELEDLNPDEDDNDDEDRYYSVAFSIRLLEKGAKRGQLKELFDKETGKITIEARYGSDNAIERKYEKWKGFPTEAPPQDKFSVESRHLAINLSWQDIPSKTHFSFAPVERSRPRIVAILLNSSREQASLPTRRPDSSQENLGDKGPYCTFTYNSGSEEGIKDDTCSLTCPENNLILDVDEIEASLRGGADGKLAEAVLKEKSGESRGLTVSAAPSEPHGIILMYEKGLQSICLTGQSILTLTPSELYGVDSTHKGNPNCFIATAAYGSSLDPRLDVLRTFRDRFLITNPLGRFLVRTYYKYSPKYAAIISDSETLRSAARGVLWGPVLILPYVIDYPMISLSVFLLLFIFIAYMGFVVMPSFFLKRN